MDELKSSLQLLMTFYIVIQLLWTNCLDRMENYVENRPLTRT